MREVENSMVGIPQTSIRKIALGHFLLHIGRIISITRLQVWQGKSEMSVLRLWGRVRRVLRKGRNKWAHGFLFPIWLSFPRGNTRGTCCYFSQALEKKSLPNLICQAAKVLAVNCSSKMWLLLNIAITLSPDSDLFCRLKESAINMGSLIRILTSLVLNSYNIFISFLKNSFQPALSLASGFCGVKSDRIWESLYFLIR